MSEQKPHFSKPAEGVPVEQEINEPLTSRTRASPALRLSAWILGLVLLLAILGWFLSGIR